MQHGTEASETEPMTSDQRLQLVSALADGDLATFDALFQEFAHQAFPVFTVTTVWPRSLDSSYSYDYPIDLIKALVAASSRGLQLVTPLLGSNSSSCNPDTRDLQRKVPQLVEHPTALLTTSYCSMLCGRVMETYVSSSHGNAAADMNSRQAELAATARSTGVWQRIIS
jgi:hypothetical protein